MIHQYKLNGYNIVLDVFSGSVNIGLSAIYTLPLGKREEPKNVLEDGTESTTPPGEWKPNVPADSTAIATPQPKAAPTDTITTTE